MRTIFQTRVLYAIVLLIAVGAFNNSTLAAPIKFKMSGTITVDYLNGSLPAGIADGASFEILFGYDTDTPDSFLDDPQRGLYPSSSQPINFLTFHAGPAHLRADNVRLAVGNNIDGSPQLGDGRPIWDQPDDSFQMLSSPFTANFPIPTFNYVKFSWLDSSRSAFASDSLPTYLNAGTFENPWIEVTTLSLSPSVDQFTIRCLVSEIQSVPEPGSLSVVVALFSMVLTSRKASYVRFKKA
jgi:hypothetical protein